MKRINFFSVWLILSAIVFLPVTTKAQVTIGSTATPQSFSVLELFSNETMGLRLPQLNNEQRIALTATLPPLDANGVSPAMGLQIFNTCTRCVETWDGVRWVSLCVGETPPIIINCDGRRMVVPQFAHFNLGGRVFETARAQMAYAASLTGTSGHTTGQYHHGSLFGGRFQWGRADIEHAIGEGYQLWSGATANAITQNDAIDAGFDDITGQPVGSSFITGAGSWLPTDHSAFNNLWGNGVAITTRTDNIEDLADPGVPDGTGQYFQSTSWILPQNDPCRTLGSGWRLPTQDEWERIGNYDCNPMLANAFIVHEDSFSVIPNARSPFTWVRVSCIGGACNPTTATWTSATRNGYVLYRTDELGGFEFEEGVNLLEANTPEPFLFLPAAGLRGSSGGVSSIGTSGNYSISTRQGGVNVHFLDFSGSSVTFTGTNSRGSGMSVRCVRD